MGGSGCLGRGVCQEQRQIFHQKARGCWRQSLLIYQFLQNIHICYLWYACSEEPACFRLALDNLVLGESCQAWFIPGKVPPAKLPEHPASSAHSSDSSFGQWLDHIMRQINLPFTCILLPPQALWKETEIKNPLLGRHARNFNHLYMKMWDCRFLLLLLLVSLNTAPSSLALDSNSYIIFQC